MKRWVDFEANGMTLRGYAGSLLPIDKMAELVLSSDAHEITSLVVKWADGAPIEYVVVATSETHVGSPGNTSRI